MLIYVLAFTILWKFQVVKIKKKQVKNRAPQHLKKSKKVKIKPLWIHLIFQPHEAASTYALYLENNCILSKVVKLTLVTDIVINWDFKIKS